MWVGVIGAVLLLIAWIPETYRTIKSKDASAIDLRFLAIYVIGSSLLAFYSYQINDIVFTALNSFIALMSMVELDLVLRKKMKKKR